MDILLTERQIKKLFELQNLLEQLADADPAAQAPTSGTSSKQAGGQGYPEVGKWESGVTRGPSNQVGITKWADVVGSKLNRGKANQLKEQNLFSTAVGAAVDAVMPGMGTAMNIGNSTKAKYMYIKNPNGDMFPVPKGTKILDTFERGEKVDWNWIESWVSKEKGGTGTLERERWLPSNPKTYDGWATIFPHVLGSVYKFQTPDGQVYSTFFVNSDLEEIGKITDQNKAWEKFHNTNPNLRSWTMTAYQTKDGKQYKIPIIDNIVLTIMDWFKNNWKDLLWIIGAIIAGILTAGIADIAVGGDFMSGAAASVASGTMARFGLNVSVRALSAYLAEAGVWTVKAGLEFKEGQGLTASVDLLFGWILPICHGTYFKSLGLAGVAEKEVADLGQKLVGKTQQELEIILENLTEREIAVMEKINAVGTKKYGEVVSVVFKDAEKRLISQGKKPLTVLSESFIKTGEFFNKRWYTRLYVMYKHDMLLISYLHKIEEKFGVENELSLDKTVDGIQRLRQEAPNEEAFASKMDSIMKESKNYEQLKVKLNDVISKPITWDDKKVNLDSSINVLNKLK